MKIGPVGVRRTDRQTNRRGEANCQLPQICERT